MPEQGWMISAQGMRDLARIKRAVLGLHTVPTSQTPIPNSSFFHAVKRTGDLTDGMYPGRFWTWNRITEAWDEGEDIWIEVPNGEVLTLTDFYLGRLISKKGEVPVFSVIPCCDLPTVRIFNDLGGLRIGGIEGKPFASLRIGGEDDRFFVRIVDDAGPLLAGDDTDDFFSVISPAHLQIGATDGLVSAGFVSEASLRAGGSDVITATKTVVDLADLSAGDASGLVLISKTEILTRFQCLEGLIYFTKRAMTVTNGLVSLGPEEVFQEGCCDCGDEVPDFGPLVMGGEAEESQSQSGHLILGGEVPQSFDAAPILAGGLDATVFTLNLTDVGGATLGDESQESNGLTPSNTGGLLAGGNHTLILTLVNNNPAAGLLGDNSTSGVGGTAEASLILGAEDVVKFVLNLGDEGQLTLDDGSIDRGILRSGGSDTVKVVKTLNDLGGLLKGDEAVDYWNNNGGTPGWTIYNTGVDDYGVPINVNKRDIHWFILGNDFFSFPFSPRPRIVYPPSGFDWVTSPKANWQTMLGGYSGNDRHTIFFFVPPGVSPPATVTFRASSGNVPIKWIFVNGVDQFLTHQEGPDEWLYGTLKNFKSGWNEIRFHVWGAGVGLVEKQIIVEFFVPVQASPNRGHLILSGEDVVEGPGTGGNCTGCLHDWTFAEGSGTVLNDVANGCDGDIQGPTWDTGHSGSFSLQFDGADDAVEVGNLDYIGNNPNGFEFECWTKRHSDMQALHTLIGGQNGGWNIGVDAGSPHAVWFSKTGELIVTSDGQINDTNWHKIKIVYNGVDSLTFYIDGVFDSTKSLTGGTFDSGGQPYLIGSTPGYGQYAKGWIEDMKITCL